MPRPVIYLGRTRRLPADSSGPVKVGIGADRPKKRSTPRRRADGGRAVWAAQGGVGRFFHPSGFLTVLSVVEFAAASVRRSTVARPAVASRLMRYPSLRSGLRARRFIANSRNFSSLPLETCPPRSGRGESKSKKEPADGASSRCARTTARLLDSGVCGCACTSGDSRLPILTNQRNR